MTDDEIINISSDIEIELHKCFGDTGQKYRNKYRSLMFNIKDVKNETLWRRICEKSITPYELVRLSPDDMASQELALWREREVKHQLDMIKKTELESMSYNRQYVFKTHKGEQVFEDDRPQEKVDNSEVIASLADNNLEVKKEGLKKKEEKVTRHKGSRRDDRSKSKERLKGHDREKSKDRKSREKDR